MSTVDQVHSTNLVVVIPQAVYKTAQTGASVDRGTILYRAVTIFLNVGTVTDGTHTLTIQESADNSTWTTVAIADLLIPTGNNAPQTAGVYTAPFGTIASNVNQKVGYIGALQYVRVITAESGATGAVLGVYCLLGKPAHMPV